MPIETARSSDPLELSVRHVRREEAARLRELRLASLSADPEAFGSKYGVEAVEPIDWWQKWAAGSERGVEMRTFVVVDDADRWLGLALVRRGDEQPEAAFLTSMWVAPEARRRGAASALCDACASWARASGLRELALAVFADNEQAFHAYAAAGFKLVREREWTHEGRTYSVLIMSRPV